ncbi:hypothetical protein QAD02_004514 [Eretmocerus hayati]|uniref:Uncharacterized protein n=1 Tax=Eretmocerus hayati TaxID=131215 RepID=A0ACC2NQ67_9HYME|nr:hypothetical protein QAD02_004514 [Eretmocerus hayati]
METKMRALNEISIVDLNDDCLLHIFRFLSIQDWLNIDLVCERWQNLCSLLWPKVHSLNVSSEQLGCIVPETSEDEDLASLIINLPICKKVFEKCYLNLRKINLSQMERPQITTLMDMWHSCSTHFYYHQLQTGTLDYLKGPLLECKNLEELWLCRCVVNADDVFLSKLFDTHRNLRKLVLIEMELTGECFSHLSTEVLDSLVLSECVIRHPKYLNSFVSSASNLHTLGLHCADRDPQTFTTVASPTSSRNLKGYNERGEYEYSCGLLYSICSLKNLTILGFRHADIDNNMLRIISSNCTSLKVLDIEYCDKISNTGLSYIQSMSNLKCLNIGSIFRISDTGLSYINENLQVLRIPSVSFSERALVPLLREMTQLEVLDITGCRQFKNRFIETVIDIVKNRKEPIPLEIGLHDTKINVKLLRDVCPLVKLNNCYQSDYSKYC